MDCTLATLVACLNLYVDTGISYSDIEYAEVRIQGNEMIYVERTHNPFGQLALGVETQLSQRIFASLEARHESSLKANDRGENFVIFKVRWYLFGRR